MYVWQGNIIVILILLQHIIGNKVRTFKERIKSMFRYFTPLAKQRVDNLVTPIGAFNERWYLTLE